MRNKIFGGIGMLWGGGIVYRWLGTPAEGSSAYRMGGTGTMVLGLPMLVAGAYNFFKKPAP